VVHEVHVCMKNRPLIESLKSLTPLAGGYALGGHVGGQHAKVVILQRALHKRQRLNPICMSMFSTDIASDDEVIDRSWSKRYITRSQ